MKLFERQGLVLCLALISLIALAQIGEFESSLDTMLSSHDSTYSIRSFPGLDRDLGDWSDNRFQHDLLDYKVYLPLVQRHFPPTFYVSKRGNNEDGTSWATAWNELDQIDWDVVKPGATILLDGGSTEMVYTTTLRIGSSGRPDKPITIQLASEPGRAGRVVIFGGRSTPLPYCWQTDYAFETDGVRNTGILIDDASWVVIDGLKWRGLTIYGHNQHGIEINSASKNITVRNVEIFDNGRAKQSNGAWTPDLPGVDLAGNYVTFERAIIHDNGQDAFQSGGGVGNFTLRESWLYNGREHPTVDESFNYCTHTDGIQIFNGGSLSGFLIEETIIGPGLTNGVNMGQELASNGIQAVTNDVTFRDVLFTKAADNNIMGHPNTKPKRWVIDHVTAHCPNTKWDCLHLEGSDHTVTNTIIQGAVISLPDGLGTFNGNCQWDTEGFQLGQIANPRFSDVNESDPFSLDDYSLLPNSLCAGKGSRLTSVAQLLSRP